MDKKKNLPSKYHVRYPDWMKRKACQEYLSGESNKKDIQRKYGIRGNGRLLYWLQELGYLNQDRQPITKYMPKEPKEQDPEQLKQRVKTLEKALEEAWMRAEGFQVMIEQAEKEFKIPIRKKFNTKPSR